MASWYLGKIRFQKEDEAGSLKTINETYLVDSISFTEAEAIMYKKIVTGASDFSVTAINRMRLADLFEYEDGEKWFKVKVIYFSVDDKSGDEKKVVNYMLVNADGIDQALKRITESLRTMLIPYETTDINLTSILEVIPYSKDITIDDVLEEIAQGVGIDTVVLTEFHQLIKSRGFAKIDDLKYLASKGIPIFRAISEVKDIPIETVINEGSFSEQEMEDAFFSMTKEGGVFHGLIEARKKMAFPQ